MIGKIYKTNPSSILPVTCLEFGFGAVSVEFFSFIIHILLYPLITWFSVDGDIEGYDSDNVINF